MMKFRSIQEWVSSLPVFLLLLIVVLAGNGEKIHARLLQVGELIWHDYYMLRADIPTPACKLNIDIKAKLNKLEQEANTLDGLEDLFEAEPFDRQAAIQSIQGNQLLCKEKHQLAEQNQARITAPVRTFRALESSIAFVSVFVFEKQRLILIIMLFICAITCTIKQQHIAFKPIVSRKDHWVSTLAQLFGNSLLLISAWFYQQSIFKSSTVVDYPEVYYFLNLGFFIITLVNVFQLFKSKPYQHSNDACLHSMLSIPLYIFMTFFAGGYFFLIEGHGAGLAIFFSLLIDQAGLFLNVGLYIWVGMLVKQTRIGELVFNAFVPWRMSPELLAVVAIIVMAVPTAYTGASGIIIIAMGGIVYEQLRHAGARRQLALAATAMTGSAGVVLRPCLLVVLIAALNKEVVTDQLFSWGLNTFMTTVAVFFVFALITKQDKLRIAPANEAFKPFVQSLVPLVPYAIIIALIPLAYSLILLVDMDEFSAPIILPIIILWFIVYEKWQVKKEPNIPNETKQNSTIESTIRMASSEASVHIGALLLLMGLSFVSGGVIERSGLLNSFPDTFASIWLTLGFLVIVLVGIGMVMDPFGAVVLVSSTVAQIAYSNGINPIHFWMIALVSFELGYLTPPVALNHLLTRQMVGCDETTKAALEGDNFWYRHEKILLPLVTMGTTLLLVAIVPVISA